MGYGGYRSWRPNNRRSRRARGSSRRSGSQSADRMFFLVAGLFFLAIILILAALALFAR